MDEKERYAKEKQIELLTELITQHSDHTVWVDTDPCTSHANPEPAVLASTLRKKLKELKKEIGE